ncbi:tetratricopeptide repeat protein [Streptomyces sp. NPDC049597]|uniref:tetratricopeptide repeat protein n=1 Tax=Streptomyces sp. NPDC049597 TaxID=3155276 RepID=UPI003413DB01
MKSETLKNAAVSTLVGATLVTGVILLAPGWGEETGTGPATQRSAVRAMAAAGAGAPAAPADLKALIGDYEDWLHRHPGDGPSWAVLGAAYVERGTRFARPQDFSKAEEALERSMELRTAKDREDVRALVGTAALANARHDYVTARLWGERARRLAPTTWTVYPVLVDAYTGLGNLNAAGKAMDTLHELHSGPQVQDREAQLYRDRGWREDAAALAYDATEQAETGAAKATALVRQGELAWERGEAAEAVDHYDAALEADPGSHRALAGRARALAALDRTDEAQRDYEEALDLAPLPEYALEAGELAESLGLDGDAATQYARVRTLVEEARAHGVDGDLVLARYEADHGDPESAVRRLQDQWWRGHRSVAVADAMGWALYRADRAEDALPFAKLTTGQGARNALFWYHRGKIERALGNEGRARRHIEEALRMNPDFSPLHAPRAREVLEALGEPSAGGPVDVDGDGLPDKEPWVPPAVPPATASPGAGVPSAGPSAGVPSGSPSAGVPSAGPSVAPSQPVAQPSASPSPSPSWSPSVPASASPAVTGTR